ncbi:D-2-hydroxyacid dehydrogenase family protein [Serratia marcescens]|nr:D-2-hydroxyacid dehydrogenase family protein [Serratia marcescens]
MKIAILDDFQCAARKSADWSSVDARANVTVFSDHLMDVDALATQLQSFDAICLMRERTPVNHALLTRLPNLKYIGSTGPSNASIDLDAAKKQGITVTYTDGVGNGAPELTWALIMASARHILVETQSIHSGGWQLTVGEDLEGATLGIIGLGRIGTKIAAIGGVFGMRVIAWSENLTVEKAQAAGAQLVDKETLLRESDWLTLHLVLSERSRSIIDASDLTLMKPSAWLVNTSRGPLINEAALIDALTRRTIGGAALDVFDTEPLSLSHPFRYMENVIATPHIGYVTRRAYKVFYQQSVDNLVAWMNGDPIRIMN